MNNEQELKYAYVQAIDLLTAVTRAGGQVQRVRGSLRSGPHPDAVELTAQMWELQDLAEGLLRQVEAVAKAEGVKLPTLKVEAEKLRAERAA